MTPKKDGLLKDGTRRRPVGKPARGGGMPRIMWLAILVCVVGAVFLFRTQGGDMPAGIGEQQTVVTAPDVESNLADNAPHSGDVDIGGEAGKIVPEKDESGAEPDGGTAPTATGAASTPVTTPTAEPKTTTTTTKAKTTTTAARPAPEPVKPLELGPYVVQIGSFGSADNADREATRLQGLGWDARVKVGNTSDGSIIYRVQIGYFKSRAEAETFIRQNRKHMSGAIAQHR